MLGLNRRNERRGKNYIETGFRHFLDCGQEKKKGVLDLDLLKNDLVFLRYVQKIKRDPPKLELLIA
jgi:hypothetical protein